MALNKREKTLAIVTAALLAVVVGKFLFSAWRGPVKALRAQRDQLRREVDRKHLQVQRGREAKTRLDEWNTRSLPSDPEIARSRYSSWLFRLGTEVGFQGTKVNATGKGRQRAGVYQGLRFTVQAQATLDKLTQFLYKFYSAGHLHQIRSLTIEPIKGSSNLDLTFVVEALSLPGCDRRDTLSKEPAKRLAASSLDEYQKAIVQRNLFAAYKAPSAPPPGPVQAPEPPKFDPGQYTYLTGIVGIDGEPEAWVIARTTGRKYRLREGDTFEVGEIRAKVIHINQRDAEIEFDGKRWRVPMGDNLREAEPLPDQ